MRRAAEAASERFDLVLVKLGLISESDLCIAYATYCNLALVAPGEIPDQPVLADRLKLSFLKANRLLPISVDGQRVLIATADPFVDEAAKAISYMLDVRVDLAVIAPAEIERALRTLYHDAGAEPHAVEGEAAASVSSDGSEFDIERLRDIANEAPVIRLVNQIISRAVERAASDDHYGERARHRRLSQRACLQCARRFRAGRRRSAGRLARRPRTAADRSGGDVALGEFAAPQIVAAVGDAATDVARCFIYPEVLFPDLASAPGT